MPACGSSLLGGYCGTTRQRHANGDARPRDYNCGNRSLPRSLASRFACHSKWRPFTHRLAKSFLAFEQKKAAWNYFKLCTLWLQEVLISSDLAKPAQLEGFIAHGCFMAVKYREEWWRVNLRAHDHSRKPGKTHKLCFKVIFECWNWGCHKWYQIVLPHKRLTGWLPKIFEKYM